MKPSKHFPFFRYYIILSCFPAAVILHQFVKLMILVVLFVLWDQSVTNRMWWVKQLWGPLPNMLLIQPADSLHFTLTLFSLTYYLFIFSSVSLKKSREIILFVWYKQMLRPLLGPHKKCHDGCYSECDNANADPTVLTALKQKPSLYWDFMHTVVCSSYCDSFLILDVTKKITIISSDLCQYRALRGIDTTSPVNTWMSTHDQLKSTKKGTDTLKKYCFHCWRSLKGARTWQLREQSGQQTEQLGSQYKLKVFYFCV